VTQKWVMTTTTTTTIIYYLYNHHHHYNKLFIKIIIILLLLSSSLLPSLNFYYGNSLNASKKLPKLLLTILDCPSTRGDRH
jgi:hypothetical protein